MKITKDQIKKLKKISTKHRLSLILLHGSQVDDKTHSDSDIDIAVMQINPQQKLDIFTLTSDLIEIFGDTVDVADLTHANPLLLKTVTTNSQLLVGSDQDFQKLKLRAFHRYQDYKPYFDLEEQIVRNYFQN